MSLVLVVNAGSTSLKLSAVRPDGTAEPVASLEEAPRTVDAVAHRVVHGGPGLREATVLDEDVVRAIEEQSDLAPLHNAPALAGIETARRRLPGVPHVAVFDTAFHATLAPEAADYALPVRWRKEWGIRRYGFHGLSVEWAAEQVPVPRLVVCHLGGGCSVTAVRDGASVDTTMGFSPLEGLPMATRSGSIDPRIVIHLLRHGLLSLDEIDAALEQESGLLGLSDISGRVEELETSIEPEAEAALSLFAYRVACAVSASVVALGGLDALVFTAGVGEHSAHVRSGVCRRLGFLGVRVDPTANAQAVGRADIQAEASPIRVSVVPAREDVMAARHARAALSAAAR